MEFVFTICQLFVLTSMHCCVQGLCHILPTVITTARSISAKLEAFKHKRKLELNFDVVISSQILLSQNGLCQGLLSLSLSFKEVKAPYVFVYKENVTRAEHSFVSLLEIVWFNKAP